MDGWGFDVDFKDGSDPVTIYMDDSERELRIVPGGEGMYVAPIYDNINGCRKQDEAYEATSTVVAECLVRDDMEFLKTAGCKILEEKYVDMRTLPQEYGDISREDVMTGGYGVPEEEPVPEDEHGGEREKYGSEYIARCHDKIRQNKILLEANKSTFHEIKTDTRRLFRKIKTAEEGSEEYKKINDKLNKLVTQKTKVSSDILYEQDELEYYSSEVVEWGGTLTDDETWGTVIEDYSSDAGLPFETEEDSGTAFDVSIARARDIMDEIRDGAISIKFEAVKEDQECIDYSRTIICDMYRDGKEIGYMYVGSDMENGESCGFIFENEQWHACAAEGAPLSEEEESLYSLMASLIVPSLERDDKEYMDAVTIDGKIYHPSRAEDYRLYDGGLLDVKRNDVIDGSWEKKVRNALEFSKTYLGDQKICGEYDAVKKDKSTEIPDMFDAEKSMAIAKEKAEKTGSCTETPEIKKDVR